MPPVINTNKPLPESEHRDDAHPIKPPAPQQKLNTPEDVNLSSGYGVFKNYKGVRNGRADLRILLKFQYKDTVKTWKSADTYLTFHYNPDDVGRRFWVIECPTREFARHVIDKMKEPVKTALSREANITKIPPSILSRVDPFPTVIINKGRDYYNDKTITQIWLETQPSTALVCFNPGLKSRGFKFNDLGGMPGATFWNKFSDDVQGTYDTLFSWGFRVQDIRIVSHSMKTVDAQIAAAVADHAITALAEMPPAPATATAVSTNEPKPASEARAFL